MPLEAGTYIKDLNPSYPTHTDPQSQGDGHIRLIKSVLQANFPNFTDVALNSTQAQIDAAVAAVTGGTVTVGAGTLAAPALVVKDSSANVNNGLFSPGVHQVAIATNGIAALTANSDQSLNAAGNLGVGGALAVAGALTGGTGQLAQTGMMALWPVSTPPVGWLICNGQSTSGYTALAAIVGANVPNFTGRTPVGVDSANSLGTGVTSAGATAGQSSTALNNNQLPAHNHTASTSVTINDPGHEHTITVSVGSTGNNSQLGAGYLGNNNNFPTNPATTGITATGSTTVNNSPAPTQNVPTVQPSLGIYFIIKT